MLKILTFFSPPLFISTTHPTRTNQLDNRMHKLTYKSKPQTKEQGIYDNIMIILMMNNTQKKTKTQKRYHQQLLGKHNQLNYNT